MSERTSIFCLFFFFVARLVFGDPVVDLHQPEELFFTRSRQFILERVSEGKALQSIMATIPGVISDSRGEFHIRGEHKAYQFAVDGVPLPMPPENQTYSLIDPRFLQEIKVQTGHFSSSFGGQMGGVINLIPYEAPPGWDKLKFDLGAEYGSYNGSDLLGFWGNKTPGGWTLFVGQRLQHSDLRLEPPNPTFQNLNNAGNDSNVFVYAKGPFQHDTLQMGVGRQIANFSIPNTPSAQSAGVSQRERDANIFGFLSWEHPWTNRTKTRLSFSILSAHQAIQNNGRFTLFIAADPTSMPNAAGVGLPANPLDIGAPYLPNIDRRTAQNLLYLTTIHQLSTRNTLSWGGSVNFIHFDDIWDITDAGGVGTLPDVFGTGLPVTNLHLVDKRNGVHSGLFINDSFDLSRALHGNLGIRLDHFHNGINVTADQLSPRLNLFYQVSASENIRFSFNHLFTVPPLERDLTGSTVVLPQNADVYELSYETKPSKDLAVRVGGYVKNYAKQFDTGLLFPFSNIPVSATDNFSKGEANGLEVAVLTNKETGPNWFLNYTYSVVKPLTKVNETLRFPSFNAHDQRHTVSFGVSYQWPNGFYVSNDNQYGSGFSQTAANIYALDGFFPLGKLGPRGRVPRFISNVNIGFRPFYVKYKDSIVPIHASIAVLNVFDSRKPINFISDFSGTHFVKARQVFVQLGGRF